MIDVFIQTDQLECLGVGEDCWVVPGPCDHPGFTAYVPAASLADAQAEIARLRGALETLATTAQYPGDVARIAREALK